jgi:hypothetical protein
MGLRGVVDDGVGPPGRQQVLDLSFGGDVDPDEPVTGIAVDIRQPSQVAGISQAVHVQDVVLPGLHALT